jgi:hypothetical protein
MLSMPLRKAIITASVQVLGSSLLKTWLKSSRTVF